MPIVVAPSTIYAAMFNEVGVMNLRRSGKVHEGKFLKIDLGSSNHAYARVLRRPLVAFYDRCFNEAQSPPVEEIAKLPIAFKIFVRTSDLSRGTWTAVGTLPLTADLEEAPKFFKQDQVTGDLSIYQEVPSLAPHYERAASYDECLGLEEAAVWDGEHVEGRLRDHFAGRTNKWINEPKRSLH